MTVHVHICQGMNRRYIARVRWKGCRKYRLVSKKCRSYRRAVLAMARAFADDRTVKRADVVMIEDWYDPIRVCELVR